MFNSKYSNLLSMILVVLIVAILGIIGYFGYDLVSSKAINSNAQTALEEFEKSTKTIKKDTSNLKKKDNDEEKIENVVDPEELLNSLTTETEKPVEDENEPEKVYMEGYEVMGRIQIPKTKVDYPVLSPNAKRSLEIAVTIAYGPGLNEVGNTVIFGHNYRNGLFFSNNKKLAVGDKILITDQRGETIEYIIYKMYETTPNDASYMKRDTEGKREISLQTCTDDSSGRIIIWAKEK